MFPFFYSSSSPKDMLEECLSPTSLLTLLFARCKFSGIKSSNGKSGTSFPPLFAIDFERETKLKVELASLFIRLATTTGDYSTFFFGGAGACFYFFAFLPFWFLLFAS